MITLDNYRSILGGHKTVGQAHKAQSDMIMEQTWWSDIASRIGYFYDYSHDTHIKQLNDLHPEEDDYKVPMDIKFIVASSQTYSKDAITYHLQLRPSQECVVPYYKECFADRYDATYPVGLYVDLQDNKGKFNRWLVVAEANSNDPQFSTFELLRCDKIINYILDGKKWFVPAVLRSQNSYNSGVWVSGRSHIEITEDNSKFILPLDRDTEKLYYNQRIVLDNNVLSEPRVWKTTKINRVDSNGVVMFTLAQDKFNPNADYLDEDGYWWADYFNAETGQPNVNNEVEPIDNIYGVISCAGTQSIKVRGSYKKFTVNFFNGEESIEPLQGSWHFFVGDEPAESLIITKTDDLPSNEIKVKFTGESTYIGKELLVRFTPILGDSTEFTIPIVSL